MWRSEYPDIELTCIRGNSKRNIPCCSDKNMASKPRISQDELSDMNSSESAPLQDSVYISLLMDILHEEDFAICILQR